MLDQITQLVTYLPVVLAVLGAVSLCVATLAKLTDTDKDDKLAGVLVMLHDFLAKFAPGQPKLAQKEAANRIVKAGARVVYDHRTKK